MVECVGHENPSPTPPHKGEGLSCRALCAHHNASNRGAPAFIHRKEPRFSPSPLWGGVGEGPFPQTSGPHP